MLIGIPNRDFLIIFPSKPNPMRNHFIYNIQRDYRRMDYPISDTVYEYKNGELIKHRI